MKTESPQPTEGKQRVYKLQPRTAGTLPKRVEKLIIKHLKAKASAGKMYAKSDEYLEAALKDLTGSGDKKRRTVEYGTVYEFSTPQTIDDKLKRTFIVNDNFTLPAVTKTVSVKRYEVKTWVNGPKESKEDGGAQ
jgi:hypothetical protein